MTDTPEIIAARKARREAVAESNALFEAARAANDAAWCAWMKAEVAEARLLNLLARANKEPTP